MCHGYATNMCIKLTQRDVACERRHFTVFADNHILTYCTEHAVSYVSAKQK